VFAASLQTFIGMPNCVLEDRVQYSTVHNPNVFCDGHLQIVNCVEIVRIQSFSSHPKEENWAEKGPGPGTLDSH
jgi:hypothetical protein